MKKILIHILEASLGILLIILILGCIKYKANIWDMVKGARTVTTTETKPVVTDNIVPEQQEAVESEQEEAPQQEEPEQQIKQPVEQEVTQTSLLFTGDILLTGYLLTQYDNKGIEGILASDILQDMRDFDITMVNQEFPFSNRGTAHEDKQFTFRIDPKRVNVFQDLGIDIVTLANNHVLDYGKEALTDTFDTLNQANIPYVGAGNNLEEAKQRKDFELNNKKIGILAASRVYPVPEWAAGASAGVFSTYDPAKLVEEIKVADQSCDVVIVYVHWGIERDEYPQDYQRELAKKYIDAGADLIIGAHPHVLQGIEYYNGKPIIYSLGNFIFGNQIPKTVYLKAFINEESQLSLQVQACSTNADYVLQKSENAKAIYQYLTDISTNATIDSEGNITPKE